MNSRTSSLLLGMLFLLSPQPGQAVPKTNDEAIQRIVESKPIRIGDLEFVTVTEAKWRGAPTYPTARLRLELQLRITNLSDKEVVFPTFDTFGVLLMDEKGVKREMGGGCDETQVTFPIAIPPKGSFALVREAALRFNDKEKFVFFDYRDGTGSWATAKLTPGKYQVAFRMAFHLGGNNDSFVDPKPNVWEGEGTTPFAGFEYVAENR